MSFARWRLSCVAALWVAASPGALIAQVLCINSGASSALTHQRWECRFDIEGDFGDTKGYSDTDIRLRFTKPPSFPQANPFDSYAFWDGGEGTASSKAVFRVRTAFPVSGSWTWSIFCETTNCTAAGLNGRTGTVSVTRTTTSSNPTNTLYRGGFLGPVTHSWVDPGGTLRKWSTLFQDDYPWFLSRNFVWSGDTAWAATQRATTSAWGSYVTDRAVKGVTVTHLAIAPIWVATKDSAGSVAFCKVGGACPEPSQSSLDEYPIPQQGVHRPNPTYFQAMEAKIKTANDAGLLVLVAGVSGPVGAPNLPPYDQESNDEEIKAFPSTAAARDFGRWFASRMAGSFVVLSPGFDDGATAGTGAGQVDLVALAAAVAGEIRAVAPRLLITYHWGGTQTEATMEQLAGASWLDFQMMQSGNHKAQSSRTEQLKRITERARKLVADLLVPPGSNAQMPVVNGEAIYDHGEDTTSPTIAYGDEAGSNTYHYNDFRQRQAAYLAWMNGSFGFTFGTGGLWEWGLCGAASGRPYWCSFDGTPDTTERLPAGYRSYSDGLGSHRIGNQEKHFADLLRSVSSTDPYDFFNPHEQWRIVGETQASAKSQANLPEYQKLALARDQGTFLAYLPRNNSIYFDATGIAGYPPDHQWFDPKEGIYEGPTGPILKPSGSSWVVDIGYCGLNPAACAFCTSASKCAFLTETCVI